MDAHKTGLSPLLCQGKSLEEVQLVSCASRATTSVKRKYPQLDLEALAVDFALRRFRQYTVGGPKMTVITDYKPLVSIFLDTCRGSVRTDRIKLRHQDVNFCVKWEPGMKNPADFLSRHATMLSKVPKAWMSELGELEKTDWFLNFSPYTDAISLNRVIEETAGDPELQNLAAYIRRDYIPKTDKNWIQYNNLLDSFMISDIGLILKRDRIVLPKSLWKLAIDKSHQGGHPGMTRMKARIRSHFWIPRLRHGKK